MSEPKTTDADARLAAVRDGLVNDINRRERELASIKSKLAGVDMVIAALQENKQDG
jgi:hypothetical protein